VALVFLFKVAVGAQDCKALRASIVSFEYMCTGTVLLKVILIPRMYRMYTCGSGNKPFHEECLFKSSHRIFAVSDVNDVMTGLSAVEPEYVVC
jgi:hypothetical protein